MFAPMTKVMFIGELHKTPGNGSASYISTSA
jgi:hypothetical protein